MPHCGGLKNLSGTVGATTLTVNQIASHGHTAPINIGYGPDSGSSYDIWKNTGSRSISNTGGSQPHTHALSGASGAADSLPPYYALALIMRIA